MSYLAGLAQWIAQFAVGLLFVIAGVLKLAAGERWIVQARALGVERVIAVAVPPAEIVAGAGIVSGALMPWPAALASGMLVMFTALIVYNLAGGRRPPCACFGSWSAKPLSWWHVARNAALLGLIAVAVVP